MKDIFQIAAWAVAVVGGLIAAFKAIDEWRKDLRWKQAEMAKTCLDEIQDSQLASAALKMLDWTGLSFELPDHTMSTPILNEDRRDAMRIVNTVFSPVILDHSSGTLLTLYLIDSSDSNILFASS